MRERFGAATALAEAKCELAGHGRRAAFEAAVAAIERLREGAADYELMPLLLFARSVADDEAARSAISEEISDLADRYDIVIEALVTAGG
jgi:hypothetical protein